MGARLVAKGDSGKRRRGGGFRAAGDEAAGILSPVLRRHGFAQIEVLQRWPEIVGPTLSKHCRPERLQWPRDPDNSDGASLHLVVAPGWATEVQHMAPMVIEKINRFFGWKAVGALKLRQAPIRARPVKRPPRLRDLTAEEQSELEAKVADVTDPDLQARLMRLGKSIIGRSE